MARYLFTSDLRISELPERIQEVAGFVEQGNQVSAYKDKSKENNAATLKYYFNLHDQNKTFYCITFPKKLRHIFQTRLRNRRC